MKHRISVLLLCAALGLPACTADNPDYLPNSGGGPLTDARFTPDLSSLGPLDFASTDFASTDFSLLPDFSLPIPDLLLRPDLAENAGPSGDAAEDVLIYWDVGESTDDNLQPCNPVHRGKVMLASDNQHVKSGFESVRVNYGPDAGNYFQATYPILHNAGWNLSTRVGIDFFIDAQLPQSYGGWMPPGPTIVLCAANKSYRRIDPAANQLQRNAGNWIELKVPIAGGGGWTVQDTGPFNLSRIDAIEFHFDPLKGTGTGFVYTWIDGLRFF